MKKLGCSDDTNEFDINHIVSCKEYVALKKAELKEMVDKDNSPTLLILKIGEDSASSTYVKGKEKDCSELGIKCMIRSYPECTEEDLIKMIEYYVGLGFIDGIIVQLPLPEHINPDNIARAIPAEKDVDGFRRDSLFECCTPKGIIDWLEYNNYDFVGENVTVLGRSKIVGKPLVNMLIDRGATVTCCNSHTDFLVASNHIMNSSLIISAIGKPKHWDSLDFSDFNNEIVIDVGINRDENGKLCGDVNYDEVKKLHDGIYVTPVPGGVGLLTRIALMENVIKACNIRKGIKNGCR